VLAAGGYVALAAGGATVAALALPLAWRAAGRQAAR